MIIIKTQEALEAQSIVVELETIGARIEALAEKGRLEGVGNLSRWRHSEVRLPPDA